MLFRKNNNPQNLFTKLNNNTSLFTKQTLSHTQHVNQPKHDKHDTYKNNLELSSKRN